MVQKWGQTRKWGIPSFDLVAFFLLACCLEQIPETLEQFADGSRRNPVADEKKLLTAENQLPLGGRMSVENSDNTLYLNLCRLKELFKGRFTTEEAAVIFDYNTGHLDKAVNFVLRHDAKEIRQMLETEKNSWVTIESKANRMKKEHKNGYIRPTILDRARSGKIDTTARLFACKGCDRSWWRRTPGRKEVSRCNTCRVRYDPVPREKEWGWAEFKCPYEGCGREFGGWCAMDMSSPCYGCSRPIRPSQILPPDQKKRSIRRNTHSCEGCNHGNGPNMTCVHPNTRTQSGLPKVITPSRAHDSTGSTVDTFLSQSDLTKPEEFFYQSLATVTEDNEDEEGSVDGNAGSDGEQDDVDDPPADSSVNANPGNSVQAPAK